MRQRQKLAERHRPRPAAVSTVPAPVAVNLRPDRLTMLEQQMRSVFRELHVQLTRIAQLQFELDSTRHAVDALTHRLHHR